MKEQVFGIIALALLAPLSFAQSWCEESCCDEAGGVWDSGSWVCTGGGADFESCKNEWCSHEVDASTDDGSGIGPGVENDYGSSRDYGSGGGRASCCGSALILAAICGLAFLRIGGGAA
jgi:hypothetical protein